MIIYQNRYSETDEPDEKRRWARLATYNNITIAWISKIEAKDMFVFSVNCHFPTMQNDIANEAKVCFSLDEAKEFIKDRWEWFLKNILEDNNIIMTDEENILKKYLQTLV